MPVSDIGILDRSRETELPVGWCANLVREQGGRDSGVCLSCPSVFLDCDGSEPMTELPIGWCANPARAGAAPDPAVCLQCAHLRVESGNPMHMAAILDARGKPVPLVGTTVCHGYE